MEPTFAIDLSPLVNELVSVLAMVLTTIAGLGVRALFKKLGLQEERELREALEIAAQRGISLAANRLAQESKRLDNVEVRNELVALAANYVVKSTPGAVKKFNLNERLQELIEARLVDRNDIPTPHMGNSIIFSTLPEINGEVGEIITNGVAKASN